MTEPDGDRVKILASPATEAAGIAGRIGCVFGWTTPSLIDIDVVGELTDDLAINVYIDELDEGFWLDPSLVVKVTKDG